MMEKLMGIDLGNQNTVRTYMYSEVPKVDIFFGILTSIIMFVGFTSNLLTIIVFWRAKHLRNVAASFIISLSFADLIFCLIPINFTALRFFGVYLGDSKFICAVAPSVGYGNVIVSVFSIVMITINRYIKIAQYHIHDRIYVRRNIRAMITLIWVFGYAIQVPTYFEVWGKFGYDPKPGKCDIIRDDNGRSSKRTITTIGFIVPCLAIVVCYAGILFVVQRSEQRMRKHAGTMDAEIKRKRKELKRTKMVFIIFLSFVLCFLPVTIFHSNEKLLKYHVLYSIAYLLMYTSTCVNPFIYVIMNEKYRQAYLCTIQLIFSKCTRRKQSDLNIDDTHTDHVESNQQGRCNLAVDAV